MGNWREKKMITCTLTGRLGNQMFQIAATIALAKKHSVKYHIPDHTIGHKHQCYFNFNTSACAGRIFTYSEPQPPAFHEIPYSPGTCLNLNGYFQSYKYFQNNINEVRQAFNITDEKIDYVSIHVRRGDYLQNPDFPVIGIYYYFQAIEHFMKLGYKRFMVFSDDTKWCMNNINANVFKGAEFIYPGFSPVRTVKAMISCRHHIVANSSFSVIAGCLNNDPEKIVIAPKMMFKNANKDFIPDTWIRMND